MAGSLQALVAASEPVPLPAPLAGPLHFPSPPSCAWLVVWFLLVAVLAGWLLRRLWRRFQRYRAARRSPPPSPPPRPRKPFAVGSAIAALLDRHLMRGSYRQGCHELSSVLRAHWEERGLGRPVGPRFTRMTAREIEGRVGDRPATRLLTLLTQLQFGRREPDGDDLRGACDLATEVVSER